MTARTKRTHITNAQVVVDDEIQQVDVIIDQSGRIDYVGPARPVSDNCTAMDANGSMLLPAMIDDQVHFREPGMTWKADFATESRAAVSGGIATVMEMPNSNPATVTHDALEDKYRRAASSMVTNHAFYLGATNDNLDQIRSLDPHAACGVKVFMGASTGNMLVDDQKVLDGIFAEAPTLIATHCEDTPMILATTEEYVARYGDDIPIQCHPDIRHRAACMKSSTLAVELAKRHGTNLHVLHITTAEELAHFQPGEIDGKKITGEACVHHLWFERADYDRLGNFIKCNPAIKEASDRDAILEAVKDGRIDIIATDHAPHTLEEKEGNYMRAPAGLPLVQEAMLTLAERAIDGTWSWPFIAKKTAYNVAKRYQIDQRGYIREGYWADLVLINQNAETLITREGARSKVGWSPFEGTRFKSRIDATFVSGYLAYHQGQVNDEHLGLRLTYTR
ncbi:MAG: dihydroorotase [Lysobacteraceae bacterium]|nr:MAG: dihydroorotase [Xanthomonadaceae bacterium]